MAGPNTDLREDANAPPGAAPHRMLVISDLHMGCGAADGTAADPLEHFFHDATFDRLLERIARSARRRGRQCCLVLNGDVFDFVRTVRLPAPGEVGAWAALLREAGVRAPEGALEAAAEGRFSPVDRRYGFDAAEHESVWKLWLMARGHPRVFGALARWCAAGHELVIVRGNHDVEWAWPGLRRALRVLLQRAGCPPGGLRRLRFRMHHFRRSNLHVEHGHAIRWSTHVEGRTMRAGGRLRQPFGSYINRFVLNPVERLAVRAPGLASSSHLKRQLRHEPFRLWRGLLRHAFRAMPPLGRAAWRAWYRRAHGWWPTRVGHALGATLLLLPLVSPDLLAALALDAVHTRTAAALLAFATPHLGLAFVETIATVRDDTRRRARELAVRLAAGGRGSERIVVLGHTHRPELAQWSAADARVTYVNPGCWLGDDDEDPGQPRFAWCAWNGSAYARARVLEVMGEEVRCRTRSRP